MALSSIADFKDKGKVKQHLKRIKKATKKTDCILCKSSKTLKGKPFLLLAPPGKKIPTDLLKKAKKEGVLTKGQYQTKKGKIRFYFASGDPAALKTKILAFCTKSGAPLPPTMVEVYIKGADQEEESGKQLTIALLKSKMKKKAKKAKENVAEMKAAAETSPWQKSDNKALLKAFRETTKGAAMEQECQRLIDDDLLKTNLSDTMKKFIKQFVKSRSDLTSYAAMPAKLQERLLGHVKVYATDYMRTLSASIQQTQLENSGGYADFLQLMTKHHKANFVKEVSKALLKASASTPKDAQAAAESAFLDVTASLFNNDISGLGGAIKEASEEQRQMFTERFFQEMQRFITALGPISAGDGATLLWSGVGGDVVRDPALMEAALSGDAELSDTDRAKVVSKGKALAGTPIGQLFDNLDLALNCSMMGWSRNVNVWTSVSKEFAMNASGDVQIFLSEGVTAWSVFWNVELPALRNNPNVNKIYCHYLNATALSEVNRIKGDSSLDDAGKKSATLAVVNDPSVWVHKELDATPLITPNITDAQQQQFDAYTEKQLQEELEANDVDWMK